MPETERRIEIIEAVERLLARGGVNAVTMRAVAAEADVSLRLVQYYGKTKDELLSATLDRLASKSVERWQARSERSATSGSAFEQIKTFLDEALPTDQASREFHRVGVSLETLAITHPDMAGQAYKAHLRGLADHLTDVLHDRARLSTTAARLLALEAMGLAHGVGTLLMADQLTQSDAETLIQDYLEGLRPRLSRRSGIHRPV